MKQLYAADEHARCYGRYVARIDSRVRNARIFTKE